MGEAAAPVGVLGAGVCGVLKVLHQSLVSCSGWVLMLQLAETYSRGGNVFKNIVRKTLVAVIISSQALH